MEPSEYLSKSVEELDRELGQYALRDTFGSKEMSDQEVRKEGEVWFLARIDEMRKDICSNENIKKHVLSETAKKRDELFGAIFDVVSKAIGYPGPPLATLAARIYHFGVERICEGCE